MRMLARGLAEPPAPPGAKYAAAKGVISVIDAETGEPLILNTKTAVDVAMERGDDGVGGSMSHSPVINSLPRLSEDLDKSATLHMYISLQQQRLRDLSRRQEGVEAERRLALAVEPMQWRRRRMAEDYALDRMDEAKALERTRTKQEGDIISTARGRGLL
jgi:hypothetical protein